MCDRYTVIWKLFLIHPVVDSPSDNMGKRVKNKTGANISLYTVYCINDKSILCTIFFFFLVFKRDLIIKSCHMNYKYTNV